MSRYFSVEFSDLSFDRQQELIAEVKESILEDLKDEAENGNKYIGNVKNFGRKEYEGMTWQEAICREYSIDYMLWETEEEAKTFDWNFAVEEYAEKEAEEKLYKGFHHMEVEVEL